MVIADLSGRAIEKGIRWKTGTVPAAVSPQDASEIYATAIAAGRLRRRDKSEDLP